MHNSHQNQQQQQQQHSRFPQMTNLMSNHYEDDGDFKYVIRTLDESQLPEVIYGVFAEAVFITISVSIMLIYLITTTDDNSSFYCRVLPLIGCPSKQTGQSR